MEINGKMNWDVTMNLNIENHGKIGQVKAEDMMIYLIAIIMDQTVNA